MQAAGGEEPEAEGGGGGEEGQVRGGPAAGAKEQVPGEENAPFPLISLIILFRFLFQKKINFFLFWASSQ